MSPKDKVLAFLIGGLLIGGAGVQSVKNARNERTANLDGTGKNPVKIVMTQTKWEENKPKSDTMAVDTLSFKQFKTLAQKVSQHPELAEEAKAYNTLINGLERKPDFDDVANQAIFDVLSHGEKESNVFNIEVRNLSTEALVLGPGIRADLYGRNAYVSTGQDWKPAPGK